MGPRRRVHRRDRQRSVAKPQHKTARFARRAAPGVAIEFAKIDVEVFRLRRPTARKREIKPGCGCPADIGSQSFLRRLRPRLDVQCQHLRRRLVPWLQVLREEASRPRLFLVIPNRTFIALAFSIVNLRAVADRNDGDRSNVLNKYNGPVTNSKSAPANNSWSLAR